MARLAIYNGKTLVRELDLPDGSLRVGRSDQNDIVLIDPAKAVSRFHAELRVGGDGCTIVDLNSQNGTWVAGRRVQQVRLMPGQAALLGTYRLVFQERERGEDVPERTIAVPAALAEPAAEKRAAANYPLSEHRAAAEESVPVEGQPTSPAAPQGPQDLALASAGQFPEPGAAVLPPGPAGTGVSDHEPARLHAAHVGAIAQTPGLPLLKRAPIQSGRGRGVLLIAAASVCLAVAGVAGGIFGWRASTTSVGAGAAMPAPAPVPPQGELGGPPTEMPGLPSTQAEVTPAVPSDATAAMPPAGAKPKRSLSAPGRKDGAASPTATVQPKAREINPAQLLGQARAAVDKRDYATALASLEPVMRVDAGNPEALDLLAAVRSQGHDAFKRGRQFDALGRTPEAVAMYEKTIKLLPPDHPSVQLAKERLAVLR